MPVMKVCSTPRLSYYYFKQLSKLNYFELRALHLAAEMALKGQFRKILFCKNIMIFLRDIGFKLKLEFVNFI